MADNLVAISAERLEELIELEKKLPTLIEEAIAEYKKKNLEKLRAHDKANPSAVNARVKRYAEKHRQEINQKMRERRKQEKMRAVASVSAAKDSERVNKEITICHVQLKEAVEKVVKKGEKKPVPKEDDASTPKCFKVQNDIIINFSS